MPAPDTETPAEAHRRAVAAGLVAALPVMRRIAYKLVGSDAGAADLVQETALKAIEHADQFILGSNLYGWLYVIMRNVHCNAHRRAKKFAADWDDRFDNMLNLSVCGEQAVIARDECARAMRGVAALPAEMRGALEAIACGMTYTDAARAEGVCEGTIKSRVSRGRAALRVDLKLDQEG